MKNPVRGLAIIFNHESYDEIDGKQIKTRDGTSEDVKRLSGTLFELGFQVHVQENLTHAEIQGLISDGNVHCSCVTENLIVVSMPAFLAGKPTELFHVFH